MNDNQYIPPVQYLDQTPTQNNFDYNGGSPLVDYNNQISFLPENDPMQLIQMFLTYAFLIAGFLTVVFIIVGGISFILSGGNDEKVKKAVNTIRYAIIGLIIIILSFFVVSVVSKTLFDINLISYISYENIKESIQRVLQSANTRPTNNF